MNAAFLVSLALLTACVSHPQKAAQLSGAALTPSQIVMGGEQCEGKDIVVRGYLSIQPDSICLIDPERALDEEPPREAMLSVMGLDHLQPGFQTFNRPVVEFNARFELNVVAGDQFLLNGCGRRGVEIESDQHPPVVVSRTPPPVQGGLQ
jgi:hypothetical protein